MTSLGCEVCCVACMHTYCTCSLSHRALKAKEELWSYFQASVTHARQQLAAGQHVPGVLGRLVEAQDEDGYRYAVCMCLGACLHVCVCLCLHVCRPVTTKAALCP